MHVLRCSVAVGALLFFGSASAQNALETSAGAAPQAASSQPKTIGAPATVRADSVIDLVYMGATDCPPCRLWKTFDLPKLRERQEFAHIRFTEVKKWIPDPVPDAGDLPEHLRPLRDEMVRIIARKKGSPFFALLVDGKGIRGGWGVGVYEAMIPVVNELVAQKIALAAKPVGAQ